MKTLTPEQLEELRSIPTCLVTSTIETFHVRLQNVGFSNSAIHCVFPERPPMLGYAVTARVKSARPPMEGGSYYYDYQDWWKYIGTIPHPRIVVIEDADEPPGLGAFVGYVNTEILKTLGCVGLVTNGAVRDIPEIRATGFQVFAGNVSVSHAYAHVFDFGQDVKVAGAKVAPGDLLHGDLHGIVTVPLEIAADIPVVAHDIVNRRQMIAGFCHAPGFSLDELRRVIQETELKR